MSKELQALEDIILYLNANEPKGLYCKNIEVIKAALKEHEVMEVMKQTKIVVSDPKVSDEDFEKLKNQRIIIGNLEPCEIKPLFDEKTQNKLKAYKDIEEELGIELVVLIKALKDGIYWKGTTCVDTKGIFFEDKPKINIRAKCLTNICFRKDLEVVYFKDYGKTWALTREELEENDE